MRRGKGTKLVKGKRSKNNKNRKTMKRKNVMKGGTSNPIPDFSSFFNTIGFSMTQLNPFQVGVQPVASNPINNDPRVTAQFNKVPLLPQS